MFLSQIFPFANISGLPVAPGSRGTWESQLLKIPAVSPSIMNCCVMKVDYYVKVRQIRSAYCGLCSSASCMGGYYDEDVYFVSEVVQ